MHPVIYDYIFLLQFTICYIQFTIKAFYDSKQKNIIGILLKAIVQDNKKMMMHKIFICNSGWSFALSVH